MNKSTNSKGQMAASTEDDTKWFTHTPEQESAWRKIAHNDAARVARVLTLRAGRTSPEGDNHDDVYPALEPVCDTSDHLDTRSKRVLFFALIDARLGEAPCRNVCEMATLLAGHLECRPTRWLLFKTR